MQSAIDYSFFWFSWYNILSEYFQITHERKFKMKKLKVLLSVLLVLASLTACSQSGTVTDTAAAATDKATTDNVATDSGDSAQGEETDADSYSIELDSLVVDCDICSVRITGVEKHEDSDGPYEKGYWRNENYFVKVRFENKTSDVKCALLVDSASINGIQWKNNVNTELYCSEATAPGAVAEFEIAFDQSVTEDVIGRYSDIELALRVCSVEDYNDTDGEVVFEDAVHIYPYGEENATSYERGDIATDRVIVDDDDITVIVTGCSHSESDGYVVDLYCVNKTDSYLSFQSYNASVNGIEINPFFMADADAGKGIFTKMQWFDSKLEDENITAVDEIKFSLHVAHPGVYSKKITDIAINP